MPQPWRSIASTGLCFGFGDRSDRDRDTTPLLYTLNHPAPNTNPVWRCPKLIISTPVLSIHTSTPLLSFPRPLIPNCKYSEHHPERPLNLGHYQPKGCKLPCAPPSSAPAGSLCRNTTRPCIGRRVSVLRLRRPARFRRRSSHSEGPKRLALQAANRAKGQQFQQPCS